MTNDSTPSSDGHSLEDRGFRFELRVEAHQGSYRPVVFLVRTPADEEEMQLSDETRRGCLWQRDGANPSRRAAGHALGS
uniref:hypothetical protein n=1 Tax=unclassified Variovorax TaxID=663243 RepID=UPI001047F091